MNLDLLLNTILRTTIKNAKILTQSDKQLRYIFESNDKYYCTTLYSTCAKKKVIGKILYDKSNKKARFESK